MFDGPPVDSDAVERRARRGAGRLSAFVEALGARVHLMTPEAHDSLVAYLSHLPQLAASALMHLVGERAGAEGLALAGRGLRDTTRLASSPPDIWRDIAATNRDNIARAIDELIAILLAAQAGAAAPRRRIRSRRSTPPRTGSACSKETETSMSGRRMKASRTYLEMRDPSQLIAGALFPTPPARVERVLDCPPAFWRFLYTEVGRRHHWVDRLPWSADEIRAYLADPAVSLWLLTVWGAPAGYFELRREPDGAIEIAYFGLLQRVHGRGLGGHLLTAGRAAAPGTPAPRASGSTPARSTIPPRCPTTSSAASPCTRRRATSCRCDEFWHCNRRTAGLANVT